MTPQKWLITGGAGYIGAHIADEFLANGREVVIYDSLYQGLLSRIEFLQVKHRKEIPLVIADIRDHEKFEEVLERYNPYGIIHAAALKAVSESMAKPDEYFEVNFHATEKMLDLTAKREIKRFIFSSTAAVYGAPDHSNPIKETDPKNPISPYGASKLAAEFEVDKFLSLPESHGTILRFFNVVGAGAPELMDNSVENLIPIVLNKLKVGESPVIYGTDYPTPDGTCVRDYVDVRDIARAHLVAAKTDSLLPRTMNVGTGRGNSVREVIDMICSHMHKQVIAIEASRRPGDPGFLCADVSLIESEIGFRTQYSLQASVKSLV